MVGAHNRKEKEDYIFLANRIGWVFVGPYTGNVREKMQWICNNGHLVEISYDNLNRGKRCKVCSRIAMSEKQRYGPERYNEIAKEMGIGWLGPEVPNTQTKTWWLCKNGHRFDTTYNKIRIGYGCKFCAGNIKKTPDDYKLLGEEMGFLWIDDKEVKNTSIKTKWLCQNDHEFESSWDSIKQGHGCPHCAAQKLSKMFRHSEEMYINRANEFGIEYIGPLPENSITPTKWKCKCENIWETSYHANKGRCPDCGHRAMVESRVRLPEDEYIKLGETKKIKYSGPYPASVKEKTNWVCEFGHKIRASYDDMRYRQSCNVCAESSGERLIRHIFKSWNIQFNSQKTFDKCRDKIPLRFDFYAHIHTSTGSTYFLIEYDGIQHFKPMSHWGGLPALAATQRRDRIKNEFAARHNIPLIRISYKQKHKIRRVLRDAIITHTGVDPLTLPAPAEHDHVKPVAVVPEDYRQGVLW